MVDQTAEVLGAAPGDAVPAGTNALAQELTSDLVGAVDIEVLGMNPTHLRLQLLVAQLTSRGLHIIREEIKRSTPTIWEIQMRLPASGADELEDVPPAVEQATKKRPITREAMTRGFI